GHVTAAAAALLSAADGVLVDLDMTLVDSTAPVRRAWSAFAHRHGLDPDDVLRIAQGRPSRETVDVLAPEADRAAEQAAVERAEIDDTAGILALPGAHALLTSGRRLAIVTSCSTALAHARLAAAGLPVPAVLVSSDGLARGKPDPACFLIAARRLSFDPARCVVLEDAPVGISAGRAAGATVIALRTSHPDAELREAHALADDIAAILGSNEWSVLSSATDSRVKR
ncbi:MAG: HAD-superfamily hydrolase, subfamily variant 3, partial [Solirubrobacterales bacterium]|nr:HAD-superfamily hydrolase, subfamily variant 3 [Solirubrobacterales bacterium]